MSSPPLNDASKSQSVLSVRRPTRLFLSLGLAFALIYNLSASKQTTESILLWQLNRIDKQASPSETNILSVASTHYGGLIDLVDPESERLPLTNPHRPSYVQQPLCPSCMTRKITDGLTCGQRIQRWLDSNTPNNATDKERDNNLIKYARHVANEHPITCHTCDPNHCSNHSKRYYRPDDAAPDVLSATTHFLKSIPERFRIPKDALDNNVTQYFAANQTHVYPQRKYLFEYNPCIVQLPLEQIPEPSSNKPQDRPVYLASYRVTNLAVCLPPHERRQMNGRATNWPTQTSYLGLALLRQDLSILAEGVYDFNTKLHTVRMDDVRLYAQDAQLYITVKENVYRMWLQPPELDFQTDMPSPLVTLEPMFPHENSFSIHVHRKYACVPVDSGKNIMYFKDGNRTISEVFPMSFKQEVDLNTPCGVTRKSPARELPYQPDTTNVSFAPFDTYHFHQHNVYKNLITGEHGSFCCIGIQEPVHDNNSSQAQPGRRLLLGVSHSKTRFKNKETSNDIGAGVPANSFFSTFYALEAQAPYRVVAKTGRFCLGFPTEQEAVHHRYARYFMDPLRLGSDMDCPRIHFISGFIEAANDPSRLILAYGVGDCSSRFITISKQSVLQMLFPTMKLSSSGTREET